MADFAERLLAWRETHGRLGLPWQQAPTPYRVWVSEIMLQQTQVAMVVPYYRNFVDAFPSVAELAAAPVDEVLRLWSGLGYYARARNLHRAAGIVARDYGGTLPETIDALVALPGIGRSTAAAILALSRGQRHAILDGNVKRVLARHQRVDGWPGKNGVQRVLWQIAEGLTPEHRVAEYTQAIMDLGATVCTRARPDCGACPVGDSCLAHRAGLQHAYPAPRPKRVKPRRAVTALVVLDPDRRVLLERRAASGIWGGLFSFPELDASVPAERAGSDWCRCRFGNAIRSVRKLDVVAHAFTHFDLDLHPVAIELDGRPDAVMDCDDWLWYNPAAGPGVGIPAPVAALIDKLGQSA